MKVTADGLVYWTPRILCIGFAAFLALFALDVFDQHVDAWHTILGLGIHLIPAALVVLVLAIVWRHEWIGALLFPALAVVHFVAMRGQLQWIAYLAIEGPLVVIGVLFLISWRSRHADIASPAAS